MLKVLTYQNVVILTPKRSENFPIPFPTADGGDRSIGVPLPPHPHAGRVRPRPTGLKVLKPIHSTGWARTS